MPSVHTYDFHSLSCLPPNPSSPIPIRWLVSVYVKGQGMAHQYGTTLPFIYPSIHHIILIMSIFIKICFTLFWTSVFCTLAHTNGRIDGWLAGLNEWLVPGGWMINLKWKIVDFSHHIPNWERLPSSAETPYLACSRSMTADCHMYHCRKLTAARHVESLWVAPEHHSHLLHWNFLIHPLYSYSLHSNPFHSRDNPLLISL